MGELDVSQIKWDEKGLIPAILQDYLTGKVLMMAYMNKEALRKTIETKEAWFWSRSRKKLWHKGETSGNIQKVIDLFLDCDRDTLLVKVIPQGPACHLGNESCFGDTSELILDSLKNIINERYTARSENSYTAYLFNQGLDKILKKVGEEAAEVIIASKNNNKEELINELADLSFHLMVLLKEKNLEYKEIFRVLIERMKQK